MEQIQFRDADKQFWQMCMLNPKFPYISGWAEKIKNGEETVIHKSGYPYIADLFILSYQILQEANDYQRLSK